MGRPAINFCAVKTCTGNILLLLLFLMAQNVCAAHVCTLFSSTANLRESYGSHVYQVMQSPREEVWWDQMNSPLSFFPGEEVFSSHRCFSRPNLPLPPPPSLAPLLEIPPPLFPPPSPPPSSVVSEAGRSLCIQGSDRGVLSIEG
jgi:hypothetical protein